MLKLVAVTGLALIVLTAQAFAQYRYQQYPMRDRVRERPRERVAAQLQIEEVAITAGRLSITGRTAKPNQVVVLVNSGDKTASMPSRRFSFSLAYMPPTCRVDLKVEDEEAKDLLVAGCTPGVAIAKDGKDGTDGRDGRDGKDGVIYGALPGDGVTFKCWPSDLIGLWFIRDYPQPNARTIAHIAPDRAAGGNKLTLTEPRDPLKADKPDNAVQSAEYDQDKVYILNRDTKARTGLRGDIAADCRSIQWKGDGEATVRIWER